MLVYGDATRIASTEELCARLRDDVITPGDARGPEQRVAAVRTLLDVGELTQGLLDAELGSTGSESLSPLALLALRLARTAAQGVVKGRAAPALADLVRDLEQLKLPWTLRVVEPEGYLHYATYPELFARAAAKLHCAEPLTVIGIRTIGTSLGAVVAEAAGARDFITVRPAGHPFRRELRLSDAFGRYAIRLDRAYAIVDEGPGISGSSFGSVADALEQRGVPRHRITVFPSHRGDLGPAASNEHRARWREMDRHVETLDPNAVRRLALRERPESMTDLSAGAWRALVFQRETEFPPVFASRERLKYLVRKRGRSWLYKFAGLGRYGEAKLARARYLSARGLVPPVEDLRHGFMRMRWLDGVRPWPLRGVEAPRDALVAAVGRYLFELASSSGAPTSRRGATPRELLGMTQHNARELLGREHAAELGRHREDVDVLDTLVSPRLTDNRMMPWKWLVTGDGRVLKCDAFDHAVGHDLVGPQDVAWDVAGAYVELGLSHGELMQLLDAVRRAPEQHALERKLPLYVLFYLAFRGGELELARRAADDRERPRLAAAKRRITDFLGRLLEQTSRDLPSLGPHAPEASP